MYTLRFRAYINGKHRTWSKGPYRDLDAAEKALGREPNLPGLFIYYRIEHNGKKLWGSF